KELNIEVEIRVDKSKLRPIDTNIVVGDNSKIKKELNWTPSISIEQSIKDIISFWSKIIV
ncbi:MAG: GDP-mannose 4,6-dehydratase, partial [Treponemataceae bacterium]